MCVVTLENYPEIMFSHQSQAPIQSTSRGSKSFRSCLLVDHDAHPSSSWSHLSNQKQCLSSNRYYLTSSAMITTCAQGGHNLSHIMSSFAWFNSACSAERAVNEKLTETPEVYLLALVQLARTEPNEVVSTKLSARRKCHSQP